MKRNVHTTIENDHISGEYYTVIPEWLMNDKGWYEGTRLRFDIDNGDIIISEDVDYDGDD